MTTTALPRDKDGKIIIGPLPPAAPLIDDTNLRDVSAPEPILRTSKVGEPPPPPRRRPGEGPTPFNQLQPGATAAATDEAASPPEWRRWAAIAAAVALAVAIGVLLVRLGAPPADPAPPPVPTAEAAPEALAPPAPSTPMLVAPEGFEPLAGDLVATWDVRTGETLLPAGMAFRYAGVQQGDRCQGSVVADPAAYAAAITEAVRQAAIATLWVSCADIGVPVPTPIPTAPPPPPQPIYQAKPVVAAPPPPPAELQPIPTELPPAAPAEQPLVVVEDVPGRYHAVAPTIAGEPPPPTPEWGNRNSSGGGWDDPPPAP